ncbi:MAG TPA: type IV secretory system conjugative DNA transfer family protein [Candidatus Deferrimicrobiaceae bacterium]|nr:type IV secretory system conjugative DNA transfer family protein [Candidatus Deferrimicrobiaceae bacterium]
MTYANEYRLGHRAFHYNKEESLAFVLSVLVVMALAFGYYILVTRLHIRPAQLVELSLYTLYGLVAAISVTWYFLTLRKRREANWPHPPLFISHAKDRKAVAAAYERNSIVLGYNVHREPWFWPDATRVMQSIVFGATGSGKTTLLKNIITQDVFRVVGPPNDPHRIPMIIFDGKADKEFLSDLLPAIETAGRMHQLRVLDPSQPDISARYNPFCSEHGLYQEHANFIFESFDLKEDFFRGHQATYLNDLVRVLAHTRRHFNIYDVLVLALDPRVLNEQIAVARSCLDAEIGVNHQRRLNFEMSVRNLQQSFADRERVPKIQGLLNELMTFLADDLSHITGAYDDLLSLDEVIDKELILFVSLNTNKNSKAVTALGRMLLQNLQLILGRRYENAHERRRENRPMVSVILDEFAPFAYSNFAQILQTARGTNTAFLFALQSLPQLMKVGRGFKDDVSSAPNTTMVLHTRDEETTQYFLKASARVLQKRRTLTVQRTGVFEDKYEPIGFGSETDIKDTRAQDEHIKNLPVGQMEILMTDPLQGTLHSHLHVRRPRNYRFPGLEPRIYPRTYSPSHLDGANLRFRDPDLIRRHGRIGVKNGRIALI